ncbi:MAG: transcription termination/antitermination protein NusG [Terrimicrobiaceae bacterium]
MSLPLMTQEDPHWYCLKTRPRQERSAKIALMKEAGVELFCPLLRFERARKSGRVRVTEAMFPGYLFARFMFSTHFRLVASANGVSTIVSFGGHPATVSDEVINELRAAVADGGETIEIPTKLSIGEEVQVVAGPFQGIRAVVTSLLPARQRVTVLLELLGMEREVEVSDAMVLPDVLHPMAPR